MASTSEIALAAYWKAAPGVRELILKHAERRVDSLEASLTSINQRLSALSALLFAGAAISTSVVTSAQVAALSAKVAAGAAMAFAIGGAVALWGLASGQSQAAGEPPSWWAEAEGLDTEGANYWIAGHVEGVIEALRKLTRRRAWHLNAALVVGALAGLSIAIAGLITALRPHSPPSAEAIFTIKLPPPADNGGDRRDRYGPCAEHKRQLASAPCAFGAGRVAPCRADPAPPERSPGRPSQASGEQTKGDQRTLQGSPAPPRIGGMASVASHPPAPAHEGREHRALL